MHLQTPKPVKKILNAKTSKKKPGEKKLKHKTSKKNTRAQIGDATAVVKGWVGKG